MKIIIFIIFSSLLSFSLLGQNGVSVTASGKVIEGIAGIDYGIAFSLVNVETEKIYYSKLLSVFKQRHSIIENLPSGKYRIFYFGGSAIVKDSNNPIHKYFGVLEFEAGKNYYLGSFIGKMKIGRYYNRPITYYIKHDEVPKNVINTLKRRKLIKNDDEIIKTYPYKSDSLIINIKFMPYKVNDSGNFSVVVSGKIIKKLRTIHGAFFSLYKIENDSGYMWYFLEPLSIFRKRYSVIRNIPAGKYHIYYAIDYELINKSFNKKTYKSFEKSLNNFFGVLNLNGDRTYNLGNFVAKPKLEKGVNTVRITLEEPKNPRKLTRILKRRGFIKKDEELVETFPYNSDTLILK